ncbi:SCO family protein [Oceanobacillus manasiensis]|uniref:SCO family protein n=1 Tax=Oceanobacillus manasiensis TaxID=586413 RepID=UPI0005A8D534|nr:SCO family protein [Oceanobacillus manasiensis]
MPNKYKLILPFLGLLLLLTACGEEDYNGDFSYNVKDFTYTNQDNEEFNSNELEGKFWVADFVFTNCETVCPNMTSNMADLQKMLKEEGLEDVEFVSFSVDPENDTPEKLKEYAASRGATFNNWNLLTGYEFQDVKELSIKSFKTALEKAPDSDQMMHGISFFIVSPEGNAIKKFDGRQPAEMENIVQYLKEIY